MKFFLIFLCVATPLWACDQHREYRAMTAAQCIEFSAWGATVTVERDNGAAPHSLWEVRTRGIQCESFKHVTWTYVAKVYELREMDPLEIRDMFFQTCMAQLPDRGTSTEQIPPMQLIPRFPRFPRFPR